LDCWKHNDFIWPSDSKVSFSPHIFSFYLALFSFSNHLNFMNEWLLRPLFTVTFYFA
jgi:hypothetical protein